jgi:predicted GTPase
MVEEEKVSDFYIALDPQSRCDKVLNILLLGASGSGKSSFINYLSGKPIAPVGHDGNSCT